MNLANAAIYDIIMHMFAKHPDLVPAVHDAAARLMSSDSSPLAVANLHARLPLFAPCSGGDAASLSHLTLQCANQLVPSLRDLLLSTGRPMPEPVDVADFVNSRGHAAVSAEPLKEIFTRHGSDKATYHSYYILYDYILARRGVIERVFEIGLGTNNTDVVSNMGAGGRPGASLRAFREHLPNARIYGADLDRRILFTEDRIETFPVDQTDDASFEVLGRSLPSGFDLMIDDGLHSPNANLKSLRFFLPRLKVGGWAVVEDIGPAAVPLWQIVASMLPATFEAFVLNNKSTASMFAVRRLA